MSHLQRVNNKNQGEKLSKSIDDLNRQVSEVLAKPDVPVLDNDLKTIHSAIEEASSIIDLLEDANANIRTIKKVVRHLEELVKSERHLLEKQMREKASQLLSSGLGELPKRSQEIKSLEASEIYPQELQLQEKEGASASLNLNISLENKEASFEQPEFLVRSPSEIDLSKVPLQEVEENSVDVVAKETSDSNFQSEINYMLVSYNPSLRNSQSINEQNYPEIIEEPNSEVSKPTTNQKLRDVKEHFSLLKVVKIVGFLATAILGTSLVVKNILNNEGQDFNDDNENDFFSESLPPPATGNDLQAPKFGTLVNHSIRDMTYSGVQTPVTNVAVERISTEYTPPPEPGISEFELTESNIIKDILRLNDWEEFMTAIAELIATGILVFSSEKVIAKSFYLKKNFDEKREVKRNKLIFEEMKKLASQELSKTKEELKLIDPLKKKKKISKLLTTICRL